MNFFKKIAARAAKRATKKLYKKLIFPANLREREFPMQFNN